MKTGITISAFFFFFLLGSFSYPPELSEEYNIKAAFIYKFTNYIDWDSYMKGDEFVIGVLGSSPISGALNEVARTKTVNLKKIVVHQYQTLEEIHACHILFISQKVTFSLPDILSKVPGKGTLTVSEKPGYAAMGTGINLILSENKLKFEANPKVIYSSGLTASSQLLKLAIIVN